MAVLGAHRADEPKAASVMPSPLEGLNRTMVDQSYWIIRWIIQQMQSRLVIMYARAHTSRQWSFSDEAGPVMPPGEKIFY